jgi:TolA-binding protein
MHHLLSRLPSTQALAMRGPGPRTWWALAAIAVLLAAGPARAGLFDDEEARRAILDLRTRIQTTDDSAKARSAELAQTNAQLLEQVQQLRRSLLDLNTQLQAQRDDNAKLRGTQEQLARDLAELQRRLKDAAQNVDERLRKFEPVTVSLDGKDFTADPDEKRAYEAAMAPLVAAVARRAGTMFKLCFCLGLATSWPKETRA